MESLRHDIRYTLRTLRKNPGFAAVAVLSLALGIGANTAIFSIYSSIFLKKLPVEDTGSLVEIYTYELIEEIGLEYSVSSYRDYVDLRDQTTDVFKGMVIYNVNFVVYDTGEESEYIFGEEVSANYFDVLGVKPILGRTFITEEEGVVGAAPTVVLSHSCWQNRFGGDPGIIGQAITLTGHDFTVIGVAPEEFEGLFPIIRSDVWYPITLDPLLHPDSRKLESRSYRTNWIKGRLKAGVTPEQARAALEVVSARLEEEYPETNEGRKALLIPTDKVSLNPFFDRVVKGFTFALMAMVGLVLLIACTNLASMLLARALARRKEIGIRLAVGASRFRLIRQLITESILLSLAGGAVGLALAYLLIQILLTVQPPLLVTLNIHIGIDGYVLLFALLLSVGTGVVFGLLPALKTTRYELTSALRNEYGLMVGRLRRLGLRSTLVVAQVAVSALLLICAGLFLRSLGNASSVDPGFDLREGVVVTLELSESGYTHEQSRAFFNELIARVEALPGVESAAMTERMPLGQSIRITTVYPETPHVEIDEEGVSIDIATIGPNYFRTLGIPIRSGRPFNETDLTEGEPVVIVNETFATTYWPGENAIGKRVQIHDTDEPFRTIVGVASNGKYRSLGEQPRSFLYEPYSQETFSFAHLAVRTSIDGRELLQPVRNEIKAIDRHLPILDIITVREHLELMLFLPRALASILAGLGLLSLILGTTGLYGVIAYDVSRRTREVGIRLSVGAQQSQVLRLIMLDGLKLVGVGTIIGLGLAFLLTRLLGSMLFNISPADPITFAGVTVLFVVVTIAATLNPARKASTVNPVEALRTE